MHAITVGSVGTEFERIMNTLGGGAGCIVVKSWEPALVLDTPRIMQMSGRYLVWLNAVYNKQPMHEAVARIIGDLGWGPDAVWMITFTWALWYGRDQHLAKYGVYPIDMDAWLTACFTIEGNIAGVLEREY